MGILNPIKKPDFEPKIPAHLLDQLTEKERWLHLAVDVHGQTSEWNADRLVEVGSAVENVYRLATTVRNQQASTAERVAALRGELALQIQEQNRELLKQFLESQKLLEHRMLENQLELSTKLDALKKEAAEKVEALKKEAAEKEMKDLKEKAKRFGFDAGISTIFTGIAFILAEWIKSKVKGP